MEIIKVVEFVDTWENGGIHTYILNLVENLNTEKFYTDIVTFQKETELFDSELERLNCALVCLSQNIIRNDLIRTLKTMIALKKYLGQNPCDVLHLHINNGVAFRYAKIAKKAGIDHVVVHCHNTSSSGKYRLIKQIGHFIGRNLYRKNADVKIACSDMAAKWLYPKHDLGSVEICNYIVDIDHFAFSDVARTKMREKYSFGDDRVYLFVGRMHEQKNPLFLLEIFGELLKLDASSWLVMIGDGPLREQVYQRAREIGVVQKIRFIQQTRIVNDYMSMADVFLLPSRFEGNPIVVTEAQASGLPCYLSDNITKQAGILKTTKYVGLSVPAKEWARQIAGECIPSVEERYNARDIVRKNGYDIEKQICEIEDIYQT